MRTSSLLVAGLLFGSLGCTPGTRTPGSSPNAPSERAEADETPSQAFEIAGPPGWAKRPRDLGFQLRSTDGELLVNASGPFPRSELERQKQIVGQNFPDLVWTTEPLDGAELIAATIEERGQGTRVGFFVTPTAHVLITLDAPRPIGPAEAELLRTIAASIQIHSIVSPQEAEASGCPDHVVQAARTQGLCLDPAQLGEEQVQACAEHFAAEGIERAPAVAAGILEASGVRVMCWEDPRSRTSGTAE